MNTNIRTLKYGEASIRQLRGAIIGFGFIANEGHVPYYEKSRASQEIQILAVADCSDARLEIARDRLPSIRTYSNYKQMLEIEFKNLDFVDICTPPVYHAEIAYLALSYGLHVLCEKPLTTDLEDAKNLLKHALDRKRVLFPCHNYKHAPVVQTIQEVIRGGAIGKVQSVTLNTFRNTHAKGVSEWKPDWRRDRGISGGGIAMDHGSHSFYLTFEWMGGYPTSITAKTLKLQTDLWDTEDNFSAALTFPSGIAYTHLSWTSGVRKMVYIIQGTTGAIIVDDDDMQIAIQKEVPLKKPASNHGSLAWNVDRRSISSAWMDASHVNWFSSLFMEFRNSIEREEFVSKETRDALMCVQLIQSAYRSADLECKEIQLESRISLKE